MNRENRNYLKERNIPHTGKFLGRKPKEDLSRYQKDKPKKERGERNHIEGKCGQGKSQYKHKNPGKIGSNERILDSSHLLCDEYSKAKQGMFLARFKSHYFQAVFGKQSL